MRKYIAEFIGTFALIFMGCGAIAADDAQSIGLGAIGISIIFGLIIMSMIYSFGSISGAHFNPAVTIGFLVAKRIDLKDSVIYIIAQLLGAAAGAMLIKTFFAESLLYAVTNPSVNLLDAFVFEFIITFILMTVILNVSTGHFEKGIIAGIAIGGTVTLIAMFGGAISGASMNPARSFGPAIVAGDIKNLWIYIIAPILGASLAVPINRAMLGKEIINK